jgi:predicted nucleic acid-binding protein
MPSSTGSGADRTVFVDTSAFLAIKNRRDTLHNDAVTIKGRLLDAGVWLLTTDYVLDESYTIIRLRAGHRVAVEFGEELRASRLVRIEYLTLDAIEEAWTLFKRFKDKEFSFTDCTSFALMRRLGLREALAFDGHFTQAGFVELRP